MESPEKPGPQQPHSAELVPQESRSQAQDPWAINRRLMAKAGEARRHKVEMVRGIARNIRFSKRAEHAEFEIASRRIRLKIFKGPIRIAEGDSVVVAGAPRNPLGAGVYFNETTGANSLDSTRNTFRWALGAAAAAGLIAAAILLTVAIAAAREPNLFSRAALLHILIYVVAVVGAAIGGVIAWAAFVLGMDHRKIWKLVRFVAYGN